MTTTAAAPSVRRDKASLEELFKRPLDEAWIKVREGAKKQQWEYLPHERVRQFLCDNLGLDLSCDVQLVNLFTKEGDNYGYAAAVVKLTLSLRCQDVLVTRAAHGTNSKKDSNVCSAIEKAVKAAESDAWKRCAITFGPALGLAFDFEEDEAAPPQHQSPGEQKAAAQRQTAGTVTQGTAPTSTVPVTTAAGTTSTATTPPQDPTREQLMEAGFKVPMLDQLLSYPTTAPVPLAALEKSYTALSKVLSEETLQKHMRDCEIDAFQPEKITGAHYRRFAYVCGLACKAQRQVKK